MIIRKKSDCPYIIPVFIPFTGCKNKCFFCNQNAVTGVKEEIFPDKEGLFKYFKEFLSYSKEKRANTEIAFFGGNFLGMDNSLIYRYLDIATEFADGNKSLGIRFSTRPDTINSEKLSILSNYNIRTIELGIQSMDDRVLYNCGRGHSSLDSLRAVDLIKSQYPLVDTGLQIMPGLPGETRKGILKILKFLDYSKPKYLRIYPLVVLRKTRFEKMYKKGLFEPMSLDSAVEISSLIRDYAIRRGIYVIRMGLPPEAACNEDIVAGPWHESFGELVIQRSFYKKILVKIITAGIDCRDKKLVIKLNPSFESGARGFKNQNFKNLKKKFLFNDIIIEKDRKIAKEKFSILID